MKLKALTSPRSLLTLQENERKKHSNASMHRFLISAINNALTGTANGA